MTATNIIRQRDRVAIITDTAGYDSTGMVKAFIAKTATIPHLRAAVSTRGSSMATALFSSAFTETCCSFDEIVTNGGKAAERFYDHAMMGLAESGETEVDILLAGWSEARDRPESYMLSSTAYHGFEPWKFHEAPACMANPMPTAMASVTAGLDLDTTAENCDPVETGLKILEAQRSMRFRVTTGGEHERHIIGGSVIYTEITRDGISQRVLKTWNDRVDEHIQMAPDFETIHEITRQMRRAMDRAAAKGQPVS